MEVIINNSENFKNLFEPIKLIKEKIVFQINKEGFKSFFMENNDTIIGDLFLDKSYFNKFIIKEELQIEINLCSFNKILKICKKSAIINLKLDNKKDKILKIIFDDKISICDFNLDIQSGDVEFMNTNQIKFSTTVILNSESFYKFCLDMKTFGLDDGKKKNFIYILYFF